MMDQPRAMTSSSSRQAAGTDDDFTVSLHGRRGFVKAALHCISSETSHVLSFRAKGLDVPGMNLDNVRMLETPEDARQIHSACMGCNVVLVGTSFVGAVL